jgi:hypothetical protein
MTDGDRRPDAFEVTLARSLEAYAARAVAADEAHAIADRMLDVRRRQRVRIAIAGVAGALAAAIVVSVAVGAWMDPTARVGEHPSALPSPTAPLSEPPAPTASPAPVSSSFGPSPTAVGVEAPETCGFPAGTALEFAGRSTTAELDVQEVVGDPMSDDPADIYITRDPLPYGEGAGRLVCAVYVGTDFVEITMHPEDGGRWEPTSSPEGTPVPSPSDGISQQDAVDVAMRAVEEDAAWEVITVRAGTIGELEPFWDDAEWPAGVTSQRWAWAVFLVSGDRGAHVTVDFVDGAVLRIQRSIVN